MKPRITLITLGVDDLERSVRFYRDGLGLPTEGIVGEDIDGGDGAVAFFELHGGLKLGLWPRRCIAKDAGVPLDPPSATEFTLAHNVASKEAVDAVLEEAKRAGARIVKAGRDTSWGGYTGCFEDPDGHLWEVAWNPAWGIPD